MPPPPITTVNSTLPVPDFISTSISLFLLLFPSSSKPNFKPYPKYPFLKFPIKSPQFLKIPIMSQPKSNPNPLFSTPQSLSDWLKPRLHPESFAAWGVKPGTKNIHNLWLELAHGETELADATPPIRTVHVVTVRILGGDGDRILIESHQEMSDGSVRSRARPLSEKMKPRETVEFAVSRAIKEELGSILGEIDACIPRIVPGSYKNKVEERVSLSYPGLPACYVLHSVDAWVDGLPNEEFCTEEVNEYEDCDGMELADKAVSVKKHYWKWIDSDSI